MSTNSDEWDHDRLVERYGPVAAERVVQGMQEGNYDPGPVVSERLGQLRSLVGLRIEGFHRLVNRDVQVTDEQDNERSFEQGETAIALTFVGSHAVAVFDAHESLNSLTIEMHNRTHASGVPQIEGYKLLVSSGRFDNWNQLHGQAVAMCGLIDWQHRNPGWNGIFLRLDTKHSDEVLLARQLISHHQDLLRTSVLSRNVTEQLRYFPIEEVGASVVLRDPVTS